MNKIEKKDVFDLLVKNYNIKESDYNIVSKVVDELYDLEKTCVIPLTDTETFIFRKRYGINNNGFPVNKASIAIDYKIDKDLLEKIMNIIPTKLGFRIKIIEKSDKLDKMSSIDLENKKNLQNISIYSFQVNDYIKNKLMKSLIFTLQDLMQYSKKELKNIFNESNYNELINYIHSLGIKFIDELDLYEKKEIINNSSEDKINNSSIYFIDGLHMLNNRFLEHSKINNIKTLITNLNKLPDINRIAVINSIINLGLNDLYSINKKSR